MNKIEHIGIAVTNIEESILLFEALLNTSCYKIELVESESVKTAFLRLGDAKIELIQATNNESPIARFLSKNGQGIHHIAIDVADIELEIERLVSLDFNLIQKEPKIGADNKLIAFLHPKSTNGVLVELCQEKIV